MTHTPGPWLAHEFDSHIMISGPKDKQMLAEVLHNHLVHEWAITRGEASANARLMAAAPDLLAAAQEMYAVALIEDADLEEHAEAMNTEANHAERCAYCALGRALQAATGTTRQ